MSDTFSTDDRPTQTDMRPIGHPPARHGKVGILLVNLGTPDGTDYRNMRRYLAEFLSDKRVIELPRALWYPILYGIVLNRRPQKVGKAYDKIWNKDLNESYLRTFTRNQAEKLSAALSNKPQVVVEWAMRYGNPPIAERLEALRDAGCDRIVLFPLYPQYAAATTATVNDHAFRALMKMRWQPAIRTVPAYPDEPAYIEAIANSIRTHIAGLDWEPEKVLASFHGIPLSYFTKGDPYHCQCMKTARLVREQLGWAEDRLITTFQSRFGREEWLQPYTDKTVEKMARDGVRRLAVINPGFVSDCLETLEEIAGEAAEIFHEHGGEHFTHIPCLNDSDAGMSVIEAVARREIMGWA